MEHLRRSVLCLFVAGLCVMTLGLNGCGRKEKAPAERTAAVPGEKRAEPVKEEIPMPSTAPITEERVYYDFETDLNGWEIPIWAQGKKDYVAGSAAVSAEAASHGNTSMKIMADFPGGFWTAALVEIQQYLNMSPYRVISVDIYLPEGAPEGLKAKMVLTVGNNWKFVEMSRSVPLAAGKWVTLTANIEPGSYDWKRVVPDEEFAGDIRKIAIRVESNRQPKYAGPIYIDNIRAGR